MKVAYLHYHLKPGGVTTVIRQQVQNRPPGTASVVLCGEEPAAPFPAPTISVPGIGYDGSVGTEKPAEAIAVGIDRAIKQFFGGAGRCDLIHIHNPILAKNGQFLDIIRHLQAMGYPLLLQVHDFAEDGRPAVYYHRADYPSNCHYSVINSRDYRFLAECGLDTEGLHYLPNSVAPDVPPDARTRMSDFVLYPVRAIRRKNIGEALLLSAFLPSPCQLFITLPPNSPGDFPAYHHWQHLAAQKQLPVRFEMGLQIDFRTLRQKARHVLTTSISEGFGFTFLEPWISGKSMEGRLLPDICRDFSEAGVELDHLYPHLHIPVDWIGRDRLTQRFRECYRRNSRLFGASFPAASAQDLIAPLEKDTTVDFGMLDEPLQTEVIEAVLSDPIKRQMFQGLNPAVMRMGRESISARQIANNRRQIIQTYGQETAARHLEAVYRLVPKRSVHHRIDKARLMKKFLNYRNFSLLKWNITSDG